MHTNYEDALLNRRFNKSQKDLYEKYKSKIDNNDRNSLLMINKLIEQSWKNNTEIYKLGRSDKDSREKDGVKFRDYALRRKTEGEINNNNSYFETYTCHINIPI